ncbi:MAG: hypothetical protein EOR84_29110, partial [Mesorhizobium sp.]
ALASGFATADLHHAMGHDQIFDLSREDNLPEQLILGRDALERIAQTDAVRAAAALKWDEVSRSTDY